jgi:hypothetical protein
VWQFQALESEWWKKAVLNKVGDEAKIRFAGAELRVPKTLARLIKQKSGTP